MKRVARPAKPMPTAASTTLARAKRPPLSPFLAAVRKVVKAIPRGTTLAYGEVALRVGKPGAARAVVRALHAVDDLPWWRVCRAGGTFAPQVAFEQEQILRQEGWRPKREVKRRASRKT